MLPNHPILLFISSVSCALLQKRLVIYFTTNCQVFSPTGSFGFSKSSILSFSLSDFLETLALSFSSLKTQILFLAWCHRPEMLMDIIYDDTRLINVLYALDACTSFTRSNILYKVYYMETAKLPMSLHYFLSYF